MNDVIKINSCDGITKIEINGKQLELVTSFKITQKAGEPLPLVSIEFCADVDIDGCAVLENNLIKAKPTKEEVIVATKDWILKELKNTPTVESESVLPRMILAFAELTNN